MKQEEVAELVYGPTSVAKRYCATLYVEVVAIKRRTLCEGKINLQ